MNLRNWSMQHTKGLFVGVLSPLLFIPIVIFLLAWAQHYPFSVLWENFLALNVMKSKIVSIAIISNLGWFYLALNREKYGFSMGVILGSIAFLPYVLYVNFAH
jgi:hypothetical protein